MNRLVHSCGARVDYQLETLNPPPMGPDSVTLFTDAATDDPVTHCPGCGKCLAQALRGREFSLELPTGQAPGAARRPAKRAGEVRASAARAVRKMVKEARQRQAQKARAAA